MSKPSIREIFFDKEELAAKSEFTSREFSGLITQKMKRVLSSRFFRFTKAASHLISHVGSRVYGAALLSFGLVGSLIFFLGFGADEAVASPIIGLICALLSIPLLLSDKTLPILLQDFRPTEYIFYEFFCVKRHTARESDGSFPTWLAVLLGCLTGLVSLFIPFWQIALFIGIIILVYIGMESPEFIFLATLFSLPYLRFIPSYDIVLAVTLALAVISFVIKVLYGKRVFHVEKYEICLGAMLLFILISGIFVKGIESFSGSVIMILLALGYLLASNIITNRRLATQSANAIIISGTAAAIVSMVQFVIILIGSSEITVETLAPIMSRGDGVAVFLMVSFVFAVGMATRASAKQFALYSAAAALCFIGLVLSGEVFAITALILGLAAYGFMRASRHSWLFVSILLCSSLIFLSLPVGVLDFLFTYSPSVVSGEELFGLWEGAMKAFANNMLLGIGIGKESFAAEMAGLGIFGHSDSSNLFLELGLEAGIPALVCFLLMLVVRLRHRAQSFTYLKNSQFGMMANLSSTCLFILLAFGMVNYIWSEPTTYYLFWCIFGIGSATLRASKKDYRERVTYYEESSAYDSSVVDIEIG